MRKLVILACLIALVVPVAAFAAERHGTWFDEIVFFEEEDQAKVLQMMKTGDAQFFGNAFTADNFPVIQENGFNYGFSYGSFNGYLLNVAEFNTGVFNPFHIQKVRFALNNLIDRNYIVSDILSGLGVPLVTTVMPVLPTYAQIAATARAAEIMAAYDEDKAIAMIDEGMTEAGAEKVDGKWYYNGEPVKVIGIIRVEDERLQLGDYLADQLEKVGFTVDRQYKTSAQASPIWLRSDPADGQWNYYTEGWIMTGLDREQYSDHAFMYTELVWPAPYTRAWKDNLDPEVRQACIDMLNGNYTSIEEREAIFAKAEMGTFLSGFHTWINVAASPWAWPQGYDVTVDIAAGIFASAWWPRTMRLVDADGAPIAGGTIRVANPSFLTEPWNPILGSNWLYDLSIIEGTQDTPFLIDPFTGLATPNWAERADVVVQEGLPVNVTHTHWCNLSFAPEIQVPGDAWADWDAEKQEFITAAERFPDGATSQIKLTVYFPADLYDRKWHDGSNFSLADCIMAFIMNFDRSKPESAIYDESSVPGFEAFMDTFKGFRIISEDPLVYEVYFDGPSLDAETIVANNAGIAWPVYSQGPGKWDAIAIGIKVEAQNLATFSPDKAETLGVDRMSYVAGPTLQMLNSALIDALSESYIPYKILEDYVTPEEAFARYKNLSDWSAAHGGILWVGTGPMYVDQVDTLASIVVGKNFSDYPYPADKWLIYAEPKFGDLSISGPETVTIGSEATFDISVTHEGEAYPMDEIQGIKYLIIDAEGNLAFDGEGTVIADGQGQVILPADQTAKLVEGSSKLEVICVLIPVAKPATGNVSFIATQ